MLKSNKQVIRFDEENTFNSNKQVVKFDEEITYGPYKEYVEERELVNSIDHKWVPYDFIQHPSICTKKRE